MFKRYRASYFLSAIEIEGSNITYRLPESKAETELRARNSATTEKTVLASVESWCPIHWNRLNFSKGAPSKLCSGVDTLTLGGSAGLSRAT
jgi:hypothetical protein